MASSTWLSAEQACALLGVKRATLYAYASRGKVKSRPNAGTRKRSYLRDDLERLAARHAARAGHGPVAAAALRWGEPVIDSALTEIRRDGHRYRGKPALALGSFEEAAELLWGGDGEGWPCPRFAPSAAKLAALLPRRARPLDAMALALPALALADPERLHVAREPSLRLARRLVRLLIASAALPCAALAMRSLGESSAARAALVALGARPRPSAVRAVERALVLAADHELNPSSFAARVAASTGADLYACVGAALATLSGPHHGGMSARIEALLDEIERPERAARAVAERLRRGDPLPGFEHPLYPEGDPRAPPLLEAARAAAPRCARLRLLEALVDALVLADAGRPNLDVGLVAVAAAAGLPRGGAAALFAMARSAGWIAHALEQREAGFLVRPRARYIGP